MKKLLIFALSLILSIGAYSQQKKLVVDETYAIENKSGSIRIITSNDTIAGKLNAFNWSSKSYTKKKDRNGWYYEYSFSFPAEERNKVVEYINSL